MADQSNQADARGIPFPENRDDVGLRRFLPFRFLNEPKKAGAHMFDPISVNTLMGRDQRYGP